MVFPKIEVSVREPIPESIHGPTEQPRTGERAGAHGNTVPVEVTPEQQGLSSTPLQRLPGQRVLGAPRPGTSRESVNGTSDAGESPHASGTAQDPSMSTNAAKELMDKHGMVFTVPDFVAKEPPMPQALMEFPRIPASIDDVPVGMPTLRELYETYAQDKQTWAEQKANFQDLADKYNTQLAAMFDEHLPLNKIVDTWQKLGTALEGELQAILLQRYPEKKTLTELHFIDDGHYLLKKDFKFPVRRPDDGSNRKIRWRGWRTPNPKDEKTRAYLLQLKKELESQLRQAMLEPGATLNSMRDLHSKLQNQLYASIKEAVLDKKNRSDWFQNMLKNLTWGNTAALTVSGLAYAVERYIKMFVNWILGRSDSNSSDSNTGDSDSKNTNHT
jgi:hypothetical protein